MRGLRIFAVLAVGAMSMAAGGAAADWKAEPAIQALYAAAKKEGTVHVWGTTVGAVDWIPKAFAETFPGIDVQFHGENEIATKAISEARAGRHRIDVFLSSLTATMPLIQRNIIAKVDWPKLGVPESRITFDGRAIFTHNIAYTIIFNKDKVDPATVPTKWEQLLDPAYKGKMVSSIFLLPRLAGGLSLAWSKEKAESFIRGLTEKNDTMVTRAPRESIVIGGERLYSVGEIDSQVLRWQNNGLPLGMVTPEPVIFGQFIATILDKAPNPNAARLLARWIVSAEGKAGQAKSMFVVDYGPDSDNPIAKKIHSKQMQAVYDTPENMAVREKAIAEFGPIVAGQR
ncbi:MAG TPA: ABC transporter substrate-binding protein [Xanthobacteraceae bacterium]|nr:ABC transporter substrate-binding protein [Xanthobacteraceae bacterium]